MHAKTLLSDSDIIQTAKNTLQMESESIANLSQSIDETFTKVVHEILQAKGRVVVTGIGKSAIIGQKIVATLNSTGTPSLFMHAADAIHGDLGMIQHGDVVICISKSGSSPEIKALIPLLKQGGNVLVGMCGQMDAPLALQSDHVLDTTVSKEACPNNLAPTTSTAAQLAMGDALAVSLLSCRDFTKEDFARYHPGGALGKKIYLRIEDLARQNPHPVVERDTELKNCIVKMTEGRMGAVVVLEDHRPVGIITDGDLRRLLFSGKPMEGLKASDAMTESPMTIDAGQMAIHGVEMIKQHHINHLIAVREERFEGIIHIQDFMREGLL